MREREPEEAKEAPWEDAVGQSAGGSGARASLFEPGQSLSPELRLLREVGTGGMSSVWVAHHARLGHAVAVKFLHPGQDTTERNWLAREARLAQSVEHPHAVRVLEYGEASDGSPYIVMEWIEGESLAQRIAREGGLPVPLVRSVVHQVAQVLSAAHAAGVVHRDIKPGNIMLVAGRADPYVKVVDFGVAKSMRASESGTVTLPGTLVGTLAYIAPEQLVDERPADFRSDLWGLALVAYEALAARPAFAGRTRAALGSAILLGRYTPVCTLRPELPAGLDAWFKRALAGDAVQRFDTPREMAEGFAAAADGPAGYPATETGRARKHEVALHLPEKLFGRARELSAVLDAYEQAAAGRSGVLLVAGYSGIGKTALVREARHALRPAGATFVSGKCDPFDRATPYAAVVQALRDLARHAALRGETAVERHRARGKLNADVDAGEGGRAAHDAIPEIERLIGAQPEAPGAPTGSPEEARNRFRLALGRVVSSLATAEHPLVLFFDDLQWADLPSLDLLTSLATDPASRNVLLIGSYRDNEVGAGHPLHAFVDRVRAARAPLHEITLAPLGEDAVIELVSAAFPGSPGRGRLAALLYACTRGNAFFLRRMLESLAEEGCLWFDHGTRQWAWDLAAIESRPMSDNVVEFVAAEIRRMPSESRRALAAAACVGDPFEIETLATVLGTTRAVTLDALRPGLATELIQAVADVAPGRPEAFGAPGKLTFRFAHDGVRQAARSLIDDAEAARVHEASGRHLLAHLVGAERERRLFEVVDHLNRGVVRSPADPAAAELLALNLAAGRRATASAAFASAHGYYQRAHALLMENAWSNAYAATRDLHLEAARVAYLSGDHEAMGARVEAAVAHAASDLDRAAAREVRLHALVSQQRFRDAVQLAVDIVAELGVALAVDPTPGDVERAVGETLALTAGFDAAALARLPAAADPRVAAVQRIQVDAMSSAYMAAPTLLPVMACNIVRSTLAHGVCRESSYAFAIFGLVLNVAGMIDVSHAMGRLALELLARLDDPSMRARTRHVVFMHVNPFAEPVRNAVEAGRQVFRDGMESGDLEYAAWGLHCAVINGFYAGVEITEIARAYEQARAVLEHHQQFPALGCTLQFGQAVANLAGGTATEPGRLAGPEYDEATMMPVLRAINFRGAAFIVTVLGTFLRYVFGDPRGARAFADEGAEYADGAAATYHQIWWHQFHALAALAAADATSPESARAALAAAETDLDRLRAWQRFSPANHDHRVLLVEGEMARVAGRPDEARTHFERAIERAAAHGFAHEEALARELLGRVLRATGQGEAAREALQAACAAWERWGAYAKAERLRAEC